MFKKLLIVIAVIVLAGTWGCSSKSTTDKTTPATVKIVREARVGSLWEMKQVEISLEREFTLDIKLADGGKLDGYFYVEKGTDVDFQISGNSVIYQSAPPDEKTDTITSDRFSFTANQAQGLAYYLTFKAAPVPGGEETRQTIFMEIIYPVAGSVFVPIGTK
ncbi:MAG: hypothetical protein A2Z29_00400 [Chloroflexi bacterium RBG_16_56_11]|nr:MAG: hypothetical protein A2Z29_00400 [Chloroflexi bacterium RBG_16_56_11]